MCYLTIVVLYCCLLISNNLLIDYTIKRKVETLKRTSNSLTNKFCSYRLKYACKVRQKKFKDAATRRCKTAGHAHRKQVDSNAEPLWQGAVSFGQKDQLEHRIDSARPTCDLPFR